MSRSDVNDPLYISPAFAHSGLVGELGNDLSALLLTLATFADSSGLVTVKPEELTKVIQGDSDTLRHRITELGQIQVNGAPLLQELQNGTYQLNLSATGLEKRR